MAPCSWSGNTARLSSSPQGAARAPRGQARGKSPLQRASSPGREHLKRGEGRLASEGRLGTCQKSTRAFRGSSKNADSSPSSTSVSYAPSAAASTACSRAPSQPSSFPASRVPTPPASSNTSRAPSPHASHAPSPQASKPASRAPSPLRSVVSSRAPTPQPSKPTSRAHSPHRSVVSSRAVSPHSSPTRSTFSRLRGTPKGAGGRAAEAMAKALSCTGHPSVVAVHPACDENCIELPSTTLLLTNLSPEVCISGASYEDGGSPATSVHSFIFDTDGTCQELLHRSLERTDAACDERSRLISTAHVDDVVQCSAADVCISMELNTGMQLSTRSAEWRQLSAKGAQSQTLVGAAVVAGATAAESDPSSTYEVLDAFCALLEGIGPSRMPEKTVTSSTLANVAQNEMCVPAVPCSGHGLTHSTSAPELVDTLGCSAFSTGAVAVSPVSVSPQRREIQGSPLQPVQRTGDEQETRDFRGLPAAGYAQKNGLVAGSPRMPARVLGVGSLRVPARVLTNVQVVRAQSSHVVMPLTSAPTTVSGFSAVPQNLPQQVQAPMATTCSDTAARRPGHKGLGAGPARQPRRSAALHPCRVALLDTAIKQNCIFSSACLPKFSIAMSGGSFTAPHQPTTAIA